jgi:hypothetical protein
MVRLLIDQDLIIPMSAVINAASRPATRDCAGKVEIPPTAVGGWFRSDLQTSTNRILESHQRKLVDCSDPAYIRARTEFLNPTNCRCGIWSFLRMTFCRLDLNHPPTAVGGIWSSLRMTFCRKDLNNPPTAVGGISEFSQVYRRVVLISLAQRR